MSLRGWLSEELSPILVIDNFCTIDTVPHLREGAITSMTPVVMDKRDGSQLGLGDVGLTGDPTADICARRDSRMRQDTQSGGGDWSCQQPCATDSATTSGPPILSNPGILIIPVSFFTAFV